MSACWYLDFDKPWNEYLTVNILDEVQATATLYKASTLQATDPTETSVSSKPSKIRHKTLFGNHFEHELNLFLGGMMSQAYYSCYHSNRLKYERFQQVRLRFGQKMWIILILIVVFGHVLE
jgi:hypothetical protein